MTNDPLRQFAEWIVSLDDDDPQSPGRIDRRSVTLNIIVEAAREALHESDHPRQQPGATGV